MRWFRVGLAHVCQLAVLAGDIYTVEHSSPLFRYDHILGPAHDARRDTWGRKHVLMLSGARTLLMGSDLVLLQSVAYKDHALLQEVEHLEVAGLSTVSSASTAN